MTAGDYPRSRRVVLVRTTDERTRLEPGMRGTVLFTDDLGTVHVAWDNGVQLGMSQADGDEIRPLTDAELAAEQATR